MRTDARDLWIILTPLEFAYLTLHPNRFGTLHLLIISNTLLNKLLIRPSLKIKQLLDLVNLLCRALSENPFLLVLSSQQPYTITLIKLLRKCLDGFFPLMDGFSRSDPFRIYQEIRLPVDAWGDIFAGLHLGQYLVGELGLEIESKQTLLFFILERANLLSDFISFHLYFRIPIYCFINFIHRYLF